MKKTPKKTNGKYLDFVINHYELRLSYFKRMSSETAEYAKILIQNYGTLRKALESFDNDPNYKINQEKFLN